tara:strand:+ start:340 stop:996 length:657 start_codon:yes stop_codon:yes gene_type:complete
MKKKKDDDKKKKKKYDAMKLVEFILNEEDADVGVFAISLVEDPAIEENFMYFSKAGKPQKFATLNDEKRIVMGAVMIPDMPILRVDEKGDKYNCFFSKETIRRVEELYMINSKHQSATLGHERSVNGITTIETWIVDDSKKDKSAIYGFNYPVGTWVACMKIENEDVWSNYIKEGEVKGFSIEGYFDTKESKGIKMRQDDVLNRLRDIIKQSENKTDK